MNEVSNINGFTWVYGTWFVGDGATGDWLGTLGKRDGKIQFEYRFRYYADDKAHDSQDRKSWYAFSAKDDSDESLQAMLATTQKLLPALAFKYQSAVDFVDLKCNADDPKFLFELGSRPWSHLKHGSDAEKAGGK